MCGLCSWTLKQDLNIFDHYLTRNAWAVQLNSQARFEYIFDHYLTSNAWAVQLDSQANRTEKQRMLCPKSSDFGQRINKIKEKNELERGKGAPTLFKSSEPKPSLSQSHH
jgi:hypothetical protein